MEYELVVGIRNLGLFSVPEKMLQKQRSSLRALGLGLGLARQRIISFLKGYITKVELSTMLLNIRVIHNVVYYIIRVCVCLWSTVLHRTALCDSVN